ncbi:hypothetical protein GOODEAATRI_022314, partial [Goodea atripinnis]
GLQVLLEILEKRESRVLAVMEVQDRGVMITTAPQDPRACLDNWAFQDLKEPLAPQAIRVHQASWVFLGTLERRDRKEMMGPKVKQAPQGSHRTNVLQESLVKWASRDLGDLLAIQAQKVTPGTEVFQLLVLKARLEKLDFQVFLGNGGLRGPKVLLETLVCQGSLVKECVLPQVIKATQVLQGTSTSLPQRAHLDYGALLASPDSLHHEVRTT